MNLNDELLGGDFLDYQLFSIKEGTEMLKNAEGKGEKQLLVLIHTQDNVEELRLLLSNILKAAGFDMPTDAFLITTTPQDGISLAALFAQQAIQHVLVFGLAPKNVGLNWTLPNYMPYVFEEKNYLFADGLGKLNENKALKGKLWSCLKTMFLS